MKNVARMIVGISVLTGFLWSIAVAIVYFLSYIKITGKNIFAVMLEEGMLSPYDGKGLLEIFNAVTSDPVNLKGSVLITVMLLMAVGIMGFLGGSNYKKSKKVRHSAYMTDVSESDLKGSANLLDKFEDIRGSYDHYEYNPKKNTWNFYKATPLKRKGSVFTGGTYTKKSLTFKEILGEAKKKNSETKKGLLATMYYVYINQNSRPHKSGVVLTTLIDNGKEYFFFDPSSVHTVILGMTGMGKTRTVYLPSFWLSALAGHSMVITDVKGELIEMMKPFLEAQGYNVILYNFDEPSISNCVNIMSLLSDEYDHFVETGDDSAIMTGVSNLVNSLIKQEGRVDPFWDGTAKDVLIGLVHTILENAPKELRTISSVVKTYQDCTLRQPPKGMGMPEEPSLLDLHYKTLDSKTSIYKGTLNGFITATGQTYSGLQSTLNTKLSDYISSSIRDLLSRNDFELKRIGTEKTAVFLNVPSKNVSYYNFISILINNIGLELLRVAKANGGRVPIQVNFFLDEFGNVPKIDGFEKDITLYRSYDIRMNIALQSYGQLTKVYEKDTETILGNASQTIYMGTSDLETNKKITERIGKYTRDTHQVSQSSSKDSKGARVYNPSESFSTEARDIFTPDELENNFHAGNVLVMAKGKYPFAQQTLDFSQLTATKDMGFPILTNSPYSEKALGEELYGILELKKDHPGVRISGGKVTVDNQLLTSLVRAERRIKIDKEYKRVINNDFWMLSDKKFSDPKEKKEVIEFEENSLKKSTLEQRRNEFKKFEEIQALQEKKEEMLQSTKALGEKKMEELTDAFTKTKSSIASIIEYGEEYEEFTFEINPLPKGEEDGEEDIEELEELEDYSEEIGEVTRKSKRMMEDLLSGIEDEIDS